MACKRSGVRSRAPSAKCRPGGFIREFWDPGPRKQTMSWHCEAVLALLEARGAVYCVDEPGGLPCVLRVTVGYACVRLRGPDHGHFYAGSYGEAGPEMAGLPRHRMGHCGPRRLRLIHQTTERPTPSATCGH